jgi:ubiquinone/menaquinone biosynthesis C-methylase UbiE
MQKNSFDTYAARYDEHFTFSPIGKMQRKRVHRFLGNYINRSYKVLEVNCGTGEDARWLNGCVRKVVATDVSEGMITVCHTKNIQDVQFEVCDSRKIAGRFERGYFDMIFSNFGGLNCLSPAEIKEFSAGAATCLSPGGLMIAVIMGRKCSWERFYFKRKKDPRFRRRESREGVETIIDTQKFHTWYYSPLEFAALFSDTFQLIDYRPVGLFVPPSYLDKYFRNKGFLLYALFLLDKLFPFSFLSDKADHYLIVLKKKAATS